MDMGLLGVEGARSRILACRGGERYERGGVVKRGLGAAVAVAIVLAGCGVVSAAQQQQRAAVPVQQPAAAADAEPVTKGDLTGVWQGVVATPEGSSRIVLKISKTGVGELRTVWYNVDRNGAAHDALMTLEGVNYSFDHPQANVRFEGKVSADWRSIAGTWKSPDTKPGVTVFVRATKETAWSIPAVKAPPKPMLDPDPSFAVATIKPSDPNSKSMVFGGMYYNVKGHTFIEQNATVAEIVLWAYSIHTAQLLNRPKWADSMKIDITGEQDGEGAPSNDQWKIMVRKLLAERMQLVVHHEQRSCRCMC